MKDFYIYDQFLQCNTKTNDTLNMLKGMWMTYEKCLSSSVIRTMQIKLQHNTTHTLNEQGKNAISNSEDAEYANHQYMQQHVSSKASY